ncbi:MAG: hypothetical protein ACHQD9_04845, partial [Chitinophagales bacterium]
LKYGKEEESAGIWKEMLNSFPLSEGSRDIHARVYTSMTGRVSTVIQDLILKSINDHNPLMYYWVINTKVQELYRNFIQLCDSSSRDMFKIEREVGSVKNYDGTITECNIFHLQFGKAKDSLAIWNEILDEVQNVGGPPLRMMTDIVGPSYTLIIEATHQRLTDISPKIEFWFGNEKLKSLHQKFMPLVANAERDYLLVDYNF